MKLGILVNSAENLAQVLGITKAAARQQGIEAIVFVMDDGTRLFSRQEFCELGGLRGVSMSYCKHSAEELGVETDHLPASIAAGSQYNNAMMNNRADKVIVL